MKKSLRSAGRFSAIGLEMGLCVGLGIFLGHLADTKWGTDPWGVIIGLILGLGAAASSFYKTYKLAKKLEKTGD